MRLAGSCTADQHDVALLNDEAAAREIADERLVDRRILEDEVVDVLGERQFGDGELIADGARLLLGDLGLQEVADEALWLVLALHRHGERFVVCGAHAVELERTHHVENFGAFHCQALLKASYLAQSAIGACRSTSEAGVAIGPIGGGSRRRARMLMITSAEWTASASASPQAASTAGKPSVPVVVQSAVPFASYA